MQYIHANSKTPSVSDLYLSMYLLSNIPSRFEHVVDIPYTCLVEILPSGSMNDFTTFITSVDKTPLIPRMTVVLISFVMLVTY